MKNNIENLTLESLLDNIKCKSTNKNGVIKFNCYKTELYINTLEKKFKNKKMKYLSSKNKYDTNIFKYLECPYKRISYSAIINMAYEYARNYYIPYGIIPDNWKSRNVLLMAGILEYNEDTFKRYIFNEIVKISMTSTVGKLKNKEYSILKNYKKFLQNENKIQKNDIDNLKSEWIYLLKSYQEIFNNNILQQILNNIYSKSLQDNYLLRNKEYNKIIENWSKYISLSSTIIHKIEGSFDYDKKLIKLNITVNNPFIEQLEVINCEKSYIEQSDFIKNQCKKAI